MSPADIIAIVAILLIVGAASAYIIKAKKSGKRCIGCPDSATCGKGGCSGSCSSCTACNSCPSSTTAAKAESKDEKERE